MTVLQTYSYFQYLLSVGPDFSQANRGFLYPFVGGYFIGRVQVIILFVQFVLHLGRSSLLLPYPMLVLNQFPTAVIMHESPD